MSVTCEMPKYKCHKEVWAFKIKEIVQSDAKVEIEGGSWEIFADDIAAKITVSHDWVVKNKPEPGGYYVLYKGGYSAWSPADAFEEGYSRIN